MSLEFKIWLYGTSTSKSRKTLVRIPESSIAKAKGFHVFFRKSEKATWNRLTSEIELIPSFIRSKADKLIYLESFIDNAKEVLSPKPKPKPKPEPKKKPEPKPEPKPKEIELPPLPKAPRVTLTKKQFNAQMSRIIFDELDLEKMKWSEPRIDSFIEKLWRGYGHAPHLIASEEFRRSLVTKEIKRIKDKKAKKRQGEMEEAYRKDLEKRNVSLDPSEVEGDVKVQFKEVFNTQYMKDKDEMTMKTLEDGFVVDKDRQSLFAQVIVDYDKSIVVGKDALFGKDEMANIAFDKVRGDMEKLFDQAMGKGLFRKGDEPEYSFRVLVPLVDAKGEIPSTAISKKGKRRVGHGFSTSRVKIKTKKDLKAALDELYETMKPALTRYIKLNHAAGFMISGFSIERIIR